MALTPLDIQKMRFPQKMRGCDPAEVEAFLRLAAEELTARLGCKIAMAGILRRKPR